MHLEELLVRMHVDHQDLNVTHTLTCLAYFHLETSLVPYKEDSLPSSESP